MTIRKKNQIIRKSKGLKRRRCAFFPRIERSSGGSSEGSAKGFGRCKARLVGNLFLRQYFALQNQGLCVFNPFAVDEIVERAMKLLVDEPGDVGTVGMQLHGNAVERKAFMEKGFFFINQPDECRKYKGKTIAQLVRMRVFILPPAVEKIHVVMGKLQLRHR